MGLLSAFMRQPQTQAQQPGGQPLPAATAASQPEFTQRMALTGQLQPGALGGQPMQGMPQFSSGDFKQIQDARLAMMLRADPRFGQRVAQFLQMTVPQKRPSHLLGGGN